MKKTIILFLILIITVLLPVYSKGKPTDSLTFPLISDNLHGMIYKYYDKGWGLRSETKKLVPPIYEDIENKAGMIVVRYFNKYGIISKYGFILLPIKYDKIEEIDSNTCRLKLNGLYGYVVSPEFIVQEPIYKHLTSIRTGVYSVCNDSGCGVLNYNGRIIIPLVHEGTIGGFWNSDAYYTVSNGQNKAVMDVCGRKLTDFKYQRIYSTDNNVVFVKQDKKEGIVRIHDGVTIAEPIYQNVEDLTQKGFYKIKHNGKWGVIGYDGNMVYECKYGPLEINRLMNSYPSPKKFEKVLKYNYFYTRLLEINYFIQAFGVDSPTAKEYLTEILSSDHDYSDLKEEAQKIMKTYGIR